MPSAPLTIAPTPPVTEPPFCPRPSCPYHDPAVAAGRNWFYRCSSFYTRCRGYIPQFRCKHCKKHCSTQTFSTHYWTHGTCNYQRIEQQLTSCSSIRQIARHHGYSFQVVHNRLRRLARQYLHLFAIALDGFRIREGAVFDGFESFIGSQYHPTNVHILVGAESQAVYAINATVMRRKGSMTKRQKEIRALIDAVWKPQRGALERAVRSLFADAGALLPEIISPETPWVLSTDEKKEYPRALMRIAVIRHYLAGGLMRHRTISSRALRLRKNPLWAVNYIDRELRKDMGEHVRETVKFGREMNSAMERMVIKLGSHTFGKPYRITGRANIEGMATHADHAGFGASEEVRRYWRWMYSRRQIHSHLPHGLSRIDREAGPVTWISEIWQRRYHTPPIVDRETGKEKEQGQPNTGWVPQHLLA